MERDSALDGNGDRMSRGSGNRWDCAAPSTATRWWSHVEALANDGMEGRNTGSPAHKRAADYVAAHFKKAGLEPAGTNGYIQPVRFKTRTIVESAIEPGARPRTARREPLTLGEDANIQLRVDAAPTVDAPLVFVGYGLSVPERQFNDLAGSGSQGQDRRVYSRRQPVKSLPGPLQRALSVGRRALGRC